MNFVFPFFSISDSIICLTTIWDLWDAFIFVFVYFKDRNIGGGSERNLTSMGSLSKWPQ